MPRSSQNAETSERHGRLEIPNSEFRIWPLYPSLVPIRIILLLSLLASMACASSSMPDRFDCPGELLTDWQIPAAWVERTLTPSEARTEVLTANLSKEASEARWKWLEEKWRNGDQFWLYQKPAEEPLNALGAHRGVVLIRGCTQLGFVTTRIETENPR